MSAVLDPLLAHRPHFPTVEGSLHFASHTLGAMPLGVEESLAEYARTWRERGIRAWEERWMGVPREVAGLLETLLHAREGSVSLHPNVTVAQAVALSCIDFTPARPRFVCTAEDFPSELYLYEGLARRGAEIVRVPAREGRQIEAEDIVAAIDERTAVGGALARAVSHRAGRGPRARREARARSRGAHAGGRLPGGRHAGRRRDAHPRWTS